MKLIHKYPSYFRLSVCWRHAFSPVTYLCKLLGICSLVAFLQPELFRVEQINMGWHAPSHRQERRE
ncbi:hypothetical protein BFG07_01215 [Kosakonia cowanii]|nr:hypothetical protein BFG07_01215 [Kosakonia cowanii]